jgi:hypothetical protein
MDLVLKVNYARNSTRVKEDQEFAAKDLAIEIQAVISHQKEWADKKDLDQLVYRIQKEDLG